MGRRKKEKEKKKKYRSEGDVWSVDGFLEIRKPVCFRLPFAGLHHISSKCSTGGNHPEAPNDDDTV